MAEIEGTVLQSVGPTQTEGRRDGWRIGAMGLLTVALLPIALFFWAVALAWRLAIGLAGFGRGRGNGLFAEIFTFHVLGSAFRRPEPIPVYDHVVDTPRGRVLARQEGEFQDGRILTGNHVRLRGRSQNGMIAIESGTNLSLGTHLSFRRSPWRVVFFLLLTLVVGELVVLAGLAGVET